MNEEEFFNCFLDLGFNTNDIEELSLIGELRQMFTDKTKVHSLEFCNAIKTLIEKYIDSVSNSDIIS